MANTNLLKTIVEPEIIESFCYTYKLKPLSLSFKEKHHVFFDMEPDLIGFQEDSKTLFLGEITTSGYNGHKGKFMLEYSIKTVGLFTT